MPQIVGRDLVKTFHVAERTSGLLGALGGLFCRRKREVSALDGVGFEIERGELVAVHRAERRGQEHQRSRSWPASWRRARAPARSAVSSLGRRAARTWRASAWVFGQRTQLWWISWSPIRSISLAAIYDLSPERLPRTAPRSSWSASSSRRCSVYRVRQLARPALAPRASPPRSRTDPSRVPR